ncbi:hypothetical protein NMY22_g19206 [Coprinellus aureogranulatus]|nr:hypothetical protein NMY22_g19206 [Coprinellus aureogranulatus]
MAAGWRADPLTTIIPLAVRGGQPAPTTSEGAHFREIFAEDFAPGPRRGSLTLSDGYAHSSDGGYGNTGSDGYGHGNTGSDGYGHGDTTDGSGSESGGYYANVPRDMDETMSGIDAPSPFSFDPHGHTRAGSTSSSSHHYSDSGSERPGSTHSLSGIPHPPGSAHSTTSSNGPPGSATTGTFFNAFDSLSLDDPAVLAQIAANGGTAPDGSPFFAHMNLEHLSAAPGGGVGFPGAHAGGDNQADPDATPMPIKEEVGGLRFMEGSKIQRPLSSLAALQPSSTNGLNWNSYLGLGTPSANANANGFLGGWTPGGVGGAGKMAGGNTGTLAGLDMAFSSGLTPAKDMDSKEMREFWKQYLKTPLTTSGGDNPMDAASAAAAGEGETTPFRRPRVTSMPSSNKTPLAVDRDA